MLTVQYWQKPVIATFQYSSVFAFKYEGNIDDKPLGFHNKIQLTFKNKLVNHLLN